MTEKQTASVSDEDKFRINVKQRLLTINSYASGNDGKGYDCFSDMGIDPETFSSFSLAKKQEMLGEIVKGIVNGVRNDLDIWKSLLPWRNSRIRTIDVEMVLDDMVEAGEALLALRDLCFHYDVKMDCFVSGNVEAACKACGYKWRPRKPLESVKECPACKTRDWK